ncbi:TRZ/ATZ family hydrolase [Methylophilus medardicus]|uniref:TRZ/ATZ family hydrolase n=2 Tax=Methylophilus medardicus TaxID=2588534 RepID=A0A5B8CS79_9PROT|nr:TRZ/ATZ family hydrolase [Methylophilus medardicus]QDC49056.1 TRZ/ATZ family hydrolase [Methylophilus medardicus]QDC52761.1 TRZ/ATZ family hydrolase [Methylophilus medardicus]
MWDWLSYNPAMVETRFIIKARWVIPMDAGDPVLEHHAVLVDDGQIKAIVPKTAIPAWAEDWPVIDCAQHALLPGFINLHAHSSMNLLKGYADDVALMPWLHTHIWPAEKRWVSKPFVHDGSLLACAEMLSGGITTFNDMYFFPQSTIEAVKRAGMRAHIGLVVLEFPSNYAATAHEYIRLGTEVRDQYKSESLLSFSFAPHAPYTVSDLTFEQIVTLSEQLNLGIHTHLHETRAEIDQSLEQFGVRPLQRLLSLGAIGPGTVLAHGVHLEPHELETLSRQGAHLAHCPSSNLKLSSGIAPVAAALTAGVNVGLGTDGAASNNRLDLWQEMRTAALLAKVSEQGAAALPAYQALSMATLHGARALGLQDKVGSIEVGKQADLVAVKLDDLNSLPCFDPISHLVYVAGREQVTHTWVDGSLLYQRMPDGQPQFNQIEVEELRSIALQWQLKLQTTAS